MQPQFRVVERGLKFGRHWQSKCTEAVRNFSAGQSQAGNWCGLGPELAAEEPVTHAKILTFIIYITRVYVSFIMYFHSFHGARQERISCVTLRIQEGIATDHARA
jgi:hypothetical protein